MYGHFHRSAPFAFGFSPFYSYPYYPYYFNYPYPNYYYYQYPPSLYYPYTYDNGSSLYYGSGAYPPAAETGPWYDLGQDWGRDLRKDTVSWDKFVGMLRSVVADASPEKRDAFRKGFVLAYGANGETVFERAWNEVQAQKEN